MKKLTTLVLLAFFVLTGMSAQTTAKEQAQTLAERFFKQGQRVQSGTKGVRSAKATSMVCRWDSRHLSPVATIAADESAPAFYAFAPEVGEGFVIVSSDANNPRVLGYSFDNALPSVNDIPDGMRDILTEYSLAAVQTKQTRASYDYNATSMGNIVVNLNTAPWGQGSPYNNFCTTATGGAASTGCVPTAYSILMYYHKWPTAAVEKDVYHSSTGEKVTLGYEYDWANMLHSYSGTYTNAQASAVATLMRDVGYAYGVVYGSGSTESGGGGEGAGTLIDVFKYKSETPSNTSGNHTRATVRDILGDDALWKQYIQQSLDAGLPIPYSSTTTATGSARHIYILDGYTDNGYYHFNWGWNGNGNGWFLLSDMTPDNNSNYSNSHRAYFMISPNRPTYTITVATDCGTCGTVSASYGSTNGTSFSVDEGSKVTLTATPSSGYVFDNWTCGGEEVSTSATYIVTASANADYVAHFVATTSTYQITTSVFNSEGGTAMFRVGDSEATISNKVVPGREVTLIAEPAVGYRFVKWTSGTSTVSTDATCTVTANADADYVAYFEHITHTVNISSAEAAFGLVQIDGGTAAASANKTVNYGTEVALKAVPNDGYLFKNWTSEDVEVSTDNPWTVSVTESASYKANFVARPQGANITITTAVEGSGSVTINSESSNSISAELNQEFTLAATPASGYYFESWKVGEKVVSTKATFTTSAQKDRTYTAVFKEKTGNVVIRVYKSSGGSALVGGTTRVTVVKGEIVSITATPTDGYKFAYWSVGSSSGGEIVTNANPYSFVALSSKSYYANFVDTSADLSALATATAGAGGTASVTGDMTIGGEVTFKAKANDGYCFSHWENTNQETISTEPYYTTVVTGALTLKAIFEVSGSVGPSTPEVYNIAVSVYGTNGSAAASSNSVTAGQQVTLTATPMAGYRFVNWTKGTDVVSTDNPYIFVPTESGEYVANFEAIPVYNISVSVNGTNGTATASSNSVTAGQQVTLTATPMAGYRFVNWTKGTDVVSTENPYIFVPTASGEYVANFDVAPSIIDKTDLRTIIDSTQALVDGCYEEKGTDLVFKYEGSLYITEDQVTAAATDIATAESVYNSATLTQSQCDDEVTRMQGVYDALAYAVNHALLPVRLTTDLANPYIYKIGIARTATSLLELDDATQKVAVAPYYELGNKAQGWYFLDGTDGKVLIASYQEPKAQEITATIAENTGEFTASNGTGTWHNVWESYSPEGLTFSCKGKSGGAKNNMRFESGNLALYTGDDIPCTWTLSAPAGYVIDSYSFNYKMINATDPAETFIVNEQEYQCTSEYQTMSITNVNSATASFKQGGSNKGVVVTNFTVVLKSTTVSSSSIKVLASNSLAEGAEKVVAVDKDSDGYVQEWTIVPNANSAGWYNIYCENANADKFYFSHHGGGANKMGFLNKVDSVGSKFQFGALEASSFDQSDAYNRLYNFVNNEVKVKGSIVGNNTAVGYYSETMAEAYNTAYDNAWDILNGAASDAACTTAYEKMEAANSALKINTPDINKRYIVRSAILDSYCTDGYVYANSADNKLYWKTGMATAPQAVWYLWEIDKATNKYMMESIHTGTCTNGFTTGTASPLNGNTGAMAGGEYVTIKSLSGDGIVGLVSKNGTMMHAQEEDNSIVSNETDKDGASAWRIEEVDLSTLKYELTIGTYGYAGLHLNFPVEIPDGLQAYIVTSATGDNGIAILEEIQNVIPANTAVIVKSEEARSRGEDIVYSLPYSANAGGNYNNNWLKGANFYQTFVAAANMEYYIFGVKGGEVGLYKSLRYTATGQVDKENGTYIKCSGNKIYLPYSSAANAAKFSFRFDGGTTTDLEETLFGNEEGQEIFDLQGRRIERITAPGLYIVNGQKRYVKAVKF